MRKILLLCLLPMAGFAQIQIGDDISGEASFDQSGQSVSISSDGTVVAIGAHKNAGNGTNSGHVRVFQNDAGSWTQIGDDIDGEAQFDESGWSVALSGDGAVVAIGAIYNQDNGYNTGHVRIFENNAGTWTQVGEDIDGVTTYDESGYSVSLSDDGSVVAIGAPLYDVSVDAYNVGLVRVFENNAGTWTQIGENLVGDIDGDRNGWSVDLSADGSVLATGAPYSDVNGTSSGSVKVFQNVAGTWTQVGETIHGEASEDLCGVSVSLSADGSRVAIGADRNDNAGDNAGHVRIFQNDGGNWTQVGADIVGEAPDDRSGFSLSLSAAGDVVAIGAHRNDGNGNNAGHVRVFQNSGNSWFQAGADIDGAAEGDASGHSVSLSGDGATVAIGAPFNNGPGFNNGHVRVYDVSTFLSSDDVVQADFTVYPNPASDFVNVQLGEGLQLERVNVYSALGRLVKSGRSSVLSINELAKGTYVLEVITNQGKAAKAIIVE
ncbi:MAG: T9SS type A sorting domain-containing protein [Cryomorphaceae bacterium]|nr:T9SS type A sorting domain-containing protein [Flavobacteriales bacterium]